MKSTHILPPTEAYMGEREGFWGHPRPRQGTSSPAPLEIHMLNAYGVNVYLAAQVGCSCAVSKRNERIFLLPGGWIWNIAHLVGRNCPVQHNFVVTADM